MEIVQVKIEELKPADYNPRRWEENDVENLKRSVREFGMVDPIIANSAPKRKNIVIGGHFRLKVAKDLGMKEVPVVYVAIADEAKERELNLRLNRNLGRWDWNLLKEFDKNMLSDIGFDTSELDDIFAPAHEDDFDAEKEYEKIAKPETQTGDVVKLGKHRLVCGDAKEKKIIDALLDGEKVGLIFTDPPYGIDYHSLSGNSYSEGKYKSKKMFNDKMTDGQYGDFLKGVLANAYANATKEKAALFLWQGDRKLDVAIRACKDLNWKVNQLAVWIKNNFVFAPGCVFHKSLEYCVVAFKNGKKPPLNKDYAKYHTNLFDLDFEEFSTHLETWYRERDKASTYEHPTQKPVRLAEPALKALSERGGAVLDFFGGSGSTLIACEQLGRRAFLAELDSRYCDVIIKRWERLTGEKAQRT